VGGEKRGSSSEFQATLRKARQRAIHTEESGRSKGWGPPPVPGHNHEEVLKIKKEVKSRVTLDFYTLPLGIQGGNSDLKETRQKEHSYPVTGVHSADHALQPA